MIRHQHPGQQPGIARRRCGECSTGGCRNQKICEHGATLPCRGSQQVSAVGRRLPTAAQRAMPGRVDIGHTAMLMALDHAGYRRLPCSALGIHVATDCQRPSAGPTGEARRAQVRSYGPRRPHVGRGAPGSCGFRTYPSAAQCTRRHAPDPSDSYVPRRSAPGRLPDRARPSRPGALLRWGARVCLPCGDSHIQERPHDAGVLVSRQSGVSRQSDQRSLLRYCRNGSFLSSTTTPLPSAMELR